jgi:hypothetical protein
MTTMSPGRTWATGKVTVSPLRRTCASGEMNATSALIAPRPSASVRRSSSSASSTNSVTTNAVKNSPIAAAAMMAIIIDSSMVMRLAARFANASVRTGQQQKANAASPITLTEGTGS